MDFHFHLIAFCAASIFSFPIGPLCSLSSYVLFGNREHKRCIPAMGDCCFRCLFRGKT
ncbi:hypothetical protein L211DRAFT_312631 [Terfezia boudieri ATCC MYA-4762]|uniref:Uncharacterized protein n=1 Tax=Terfezia boudieri ATCC MYA-4762 TaxID=1051890 RepID=A0A3N4LY25_9PEZI|nr:hypothetical protein L211DRAFT_312631 [Terfezia boudieri ATCC MYA-4762]